MWLPPPWDKARGEGCTWGPSVDLAPSGWSPGWPCALASWWTKWFLPLSSSWCLPWCFCHRFHLTSASTQSPLGIFSIPLEEEKHTALSRLKKEGKKIGGYHFTELCQGHASGEFYSWTSYKFLKSSPACVTKLCSPSAQPPHDGGEWQQGAGALQLFREEAETGDLVQGYWARNSGVDRTGRPHCGGRDIYHLP